jgi:hypothetical protein
MVIDIEIVAETETDLFDLLHSAEYNEAPVETEQHEHICPTCDDFFCCTKECCVEADKVECRECTEEIY